MKVIANIPEDMLQELKDGCFGAKHTLYDLAGAICDGVALHKTIMKDLWQKTTPPLMIEGQGS